MLEFVDRRLVIYGIECVTLEPRADDRLLAAEITLAP
jgi:hypothetical protein